MDLLKRYIQKHGRMGSLYTDRDSIFWEEDSQGQRIRTQYTRALDELAIRWIPAGSPQAKGRVERFNGTAQDRLVKELRLIKASTLEHANVVLKDVFLPWFNRYCTVTPASPNDAHRRLDPGMNLSAILSRQERRPEECKILRGRDEALAGASGGADRGREGSMGKSFFPGVFFLTLYE